MGGYHDFAHTYINVGFCGMDVTRTIDGYHDFTKTYVNIGF